MWRLLLGILILGAVAAIGRATAQNEKFADYYPLEAAPEYHKALFENEFVLVLDVSIPAGATVPGTPASLARRLHHAEAGASTLSQSCG